MTATASVLCKQAAYDQEHSALPSLADLPLPIAIIVAAFWFLQQANAANAKQIVALIDAFDKQYAALIKDYQAIVQMALEDRQESRQRWLERDRLLNERLDRNTEEITQNKGETHALRGTIQSYGAGIELIRNLLQTVAATIEMIAREILPGRSTRRKPGGAADD